MAEPKVGLVDLLESWGPRLKCQYLKAFWKKEQRRLRGMWLHEKLHWKEQPGTWVAGADEVGRGPLAGPLVAAAVAVQEPLMVPGLNDSKKLSARERELIAAHLGKAGVRAEITFISVHEISNGNLHYLSLGAMERSLRTVGLQPTLVLLDGKHKMPTQDFPQRAMVKGDSRCGCIAAASILAKVARDAVMIELDKEFPGYNWAQNKGYGTADHLEALRRLGPTPHHRTNFRPVREHGNPQMLLFDEGPLVSV